MNYKPSKDATAYMMRRGLMATRRLPSPRYVLGVNPVYNFPTAAPFPLPELVRETQRPASPDSGPIRRWSE